MYQWGGTSTARWLQGLKGNAGSDGLVREHHAVTGAPNADAQGAIEKFAGTVVERGDAGRPGTCGGQRGPRGGAVDDGGSIIVGCREVKLHLIWIAAAGSRRIEPGAGSHVGVVARAVVAAERPRAIAGDRQLDLAKRRARPPGKRIVCLH